MLTCSSKPPTALIWLADLALADRLAKAAVHAGAGPEAQFLRAHALSWLGRGHEAEAVLAEVPITKLTDDDPAKFTYLRASNMLWALADPARAKEIIDDASAFPRRAGAQLDRRPPRRCTGLRWIGPTRRCWRRRTSRWTTCPPSSAPRRPGRSPPFTPTRGARPTRWPSQTRDTPSRPALSDAPHMRFNIADAHVSALLLSGRIADAVDVAERVRRQAADLPGAAELLAAAVAGRAALGPASSTPHVCCWKRPQQRCPRWDMPSAGGSAITSHTRPRSPCAVALTTPPPRLPRSTS